MKNIFVFVLAITLGCKSAEINKNIKEIEERKTITFSKGYSKKREIQFHKYQKEFNLKDELIASKTICDKNHVIELPSKPEPKKKIEFNLNPNNTSVSEKERITEMLVAVGQILKESKDVLAEIGKYQKELYEEEINYSSNLNNYNHTLSEATKTQFDNNKIENCLLKNDIINSLINLQEKDFEQERTEALILFRPNVIQRLFNSKRNKIYKTVHL